MSENPRGIAVVRHDEMGKVAGDMHGGEDRIAKKLFWKK